VSLKKIITTKCTSLKYNVLTLLTAGLCSIMSRMSRRYFGTCSRIATGSLNTAGLLGTQGGAGLGLGCPAPFTHTVTRADALWHRIQTFHQPSVVHNIHPASSTSDSLHIQYIIFNPPSVPHIHPTPVHHIDTISSTSNRYHLQYIIFPFPSVHHMYSSHL
jgi:hypothetical protein